ncbi:MAG TPA: DegT/DnrJ/EryC1/StrS family aminotransferase [Casimicrobiaceae bacterium]|nr:DegT/DnrJ/EryC1/StrS family aminotransferase [Casimicrobiaceae bacterium]
MRIPFIDLRAINARHQSEFELAFRRIAQSGRYILGRETEQFEQSFSAWNGSRHCISVANGLDALRLVLRAYISLGRIAPGDEAIVPANSFIASALAVTDAGLRVRFADVAAGTFNLGVQTLARAVTPRTRVVVPVHLYGQLAQIEEIQSFCAERNMLVVEDAAQAHGARNDLRSAGSFGNAGGFSFYPSKNLGGLGDAGCVVTDDAELRDRVRALRNYGGLGKYEHEYIGTNSRMSEMNAAVLTIKLAHLDSDNRRRREIARAYRSGIVNPGITLPSEPVNPDRHVWHLFVVRTIDRTSLSAHLESRNVETLIHYPRSIHEQPPYAGEADIAGLPEASQVQHEVLSLPMSPVMTDIDVQYVIDAVNAWSGPSDTSYIHQAKA